MEINLVTIAIPFFFLLIFLEMGFSAYHKRKLYRLNDSINDLSAGTASEVVGVFKKTVTMFAYILIYEKFRIFNLPSWPSEALSIVPAGTLGLSSLTWAWILVVGVWVLCFIGYDLAYYWNHRLSHEINFLWAGHVVHHQSEEYNLTVALRQASFHSIFTWVFYLPLALIGFSPIVMILNGQLNLIYQFWIHTKAIDKLPRWFEAIFNTPSHHRVHHGINPKYIDKNHGGTLIVFDKWFGTFEPESEEPVYGTVKPLQSFNTIWANLHYWWEMIELAWRCPRWSDKVKVFFAMPGWRPAELGGQYPIPEVSAKTFKKYDIELPKGLSLYSLVWFVITVALAFGMLVKVNSLSMFNIGVISAVTLVSLLTLGGILERKRWALFAEPIRMAILVAGAYALSGEANITLGTLALGAISTVWFLSYRNYFASVHEINPVQDILRRTA
ncbi:sterol desaturase family protein [Leptospira kmetyi]|uniref:sterol desaturase family protein n=1 Tax=Leptospira kmetyi TaxID=408139 RepID=UPI0010837F1C|nr:sterol desaturase family protein [Leptospira kmetyi]TGK21504.1 sterol desaturase family protein [Leptospira kmetyi]TGK28431.1 sterol desaturase family protein [Leptospira kmetyi]TGL68202.1 sterol desaturase family protein [Leptospira kmetyi]